MDAKVYALPTRTRPAVEKARAGVLAQLDALRAEPEGSNLAALVVMHEGLSSLRVGLGSMKRGGR